MRPLWIVAGIATPIAAALLHFSELELCGLKRMIGLPCPGCGLSRGTEALLRGDLVTMWNMHPLTPIVFLLCGWFCLQLTLFGFGIPSSRFPSLNRVPNHMWVAWIVLVLMVFALRMCGLLGGHPDWPLSESGAQF
ncbi:MAG: DUF2752 domain-containing protein [Myxococcota bacterium]